MGREEQAFAADFLERHDLSQKGYVCLCPATTWRNKHWREEGGAKLADTLQRRMGLQTLFMGRGAICRYWVGFRQPCPPCPFWQPG